MLASRINRPQHLGSAGVCPTLTVARNCAARSERKHQARDATEQHADAHKRPDDPQGARWPRPPHHGCHNSQPKQDPQEVGSDFEFLDEKAANRPHEDVPAPPCYVRGLSLESCPISHRFLDPSFGRIDMESQQRNKL
jgi:hypothetical protein